jgi:hypothetical protein
MPLDGILFSGFLLKSVKKMRIWLKSDKSTDLILNKYYVPTYNYDSSRNSSWIQKSSR